MVNGSYAAHGGNGLINRIVPEVERGNLKKRCCNKTYTISDADLSVFYRIADGVLSPLEGPMNSEEFNRVLDSEQIIRRNKKYAWTIPLAFPASDEESASFCAGETVAVQNSNGEFIEVQGTAEGKTYNRETLDSILNLAEKGIRELFQLQQEALKAAGVR